MKRDYCYQNLFPWVQFFSHFLRQHEEVFVIGSLFFEVFFSLVFFTVVRFFQANFLFVYKFKLQNLGLNLDFLIFIHFVTLLSEHLKFSHTKRFHFISKSILLIVNFLCIIHDSVDSNKYGKNILFLDGLFYSIHFTGFVIADHDDDIDLQKIWWKIWFSGNDS